MNDLSPQSHLADVTGELEWTHRVGGLLSLRKFAEERGVDFERLLECAGLPPDSFSNVENRLPGVGINRLLNLAVAATRCEHLGLVVGDAFPAVDHDALMYRRAHCSSTVGEALEALTLFQRLNSQSGAAYLLRQGSTTTLGFAVFQPHLGELAVVHDVALASLVASIRSFLGKDNWGPDEILLPRSRPDEDRPYRAYFRRRVRFDAERACIRFPSHLMALPMASPDPVGARELETEGLRRLREALLPRLYRSLRLLLLDGAVTGDGIAQHLAMHRRTLDRRLRELGTSFQAVLDEVRFDIARQLLAETQLTVATIASSIGYSESSSLVHAFQRWSGTSPMKWRLLQQDAHAPSHPRADG